MAGAVNQRLERGGGGEREGRENLQGPGPPVKETLTLLQSVAESRSQIYGKVKMGGTCMHDPLISY